MSVTRKIILHTLIAALFIPGAAVYVAAQGRAAEKRNAREPERVAPPATIDRTSDAPEVVRYSYEFTQPDFLIRHIAIEHDARGRGKITFERKNEDAITEPFELSEASLTRITSLWNALQFLETEADYQSEKQFPHLGTMRIGMKRGGRERSTEFNWTNDASVASLAKEYRRAADQAVFVFNITVARENRPLEAPKLLDHLDSLLRRGELSDPQQLVALLRDLNGDERLPLIARNHAGRLLKKIEK